MNRFARRSRTMALFLIFATLASLSGSSLIGIPRVHAVLASTSTSSVANALGFIGITEQQNGVPPDVQVAAGPSSIMEMVNNQRAVYGKQGTLLQVQPLSSFFNTGTDFISDPKELYDAPSGRWFTSILHCAGINSPCPDSISIGRVELAVSASSDPTGAWYHTTIAVGLGLLGDQPLIGVNDDKFVVSVNQFNASVFLGAHWWVANKSDLIAGSTTPRLISFGPYPSLVSVYPVQSLSPSSIEHMVVTGGITSNNAPPSLNQFKVISISGVPGISPVTNSTAVFSVSQPIQVPPEGKEPKPNCGTCVNTSTTIATNDYRVLTGSWYKDRLWFGLNDACTRNLGSLNVTHACARLIQVDTFANLVRQDMDCCTSAGNDYYYPSLQIDSMGNLDVIVGFSNQGINYPSLAVVGQAVNDLANSTTAPKTIVAGTTDDLSGRYGDYFGAAVDPSDPTLTWVAGEYHNKTLGDCAFGPCWATYITEMRERPVIALSNTSNFLGYTVTTNGTLSMSQPLNNITISGQITVGASNSSGVVFSRTYSITNVIVKNTTSGRPQSPYQAEFILNVGVNSCPGYTNQCPLSSDNTLTFDGTAITVTTQASRSLDVNHDGSVGTDDLNAVSAAYGCNQGQTCYDPRDDVDGNGTINVYDLSLVAIYGNSRDYT